FHSNVKPSGKTSSKPFSAGKASLRLGQRPSIFGIRFQTNLPFSLATPHSNQLLLFASHANRPTGIASSNSLEKIPPRTPFNSASFDTSFPHRTFPENSPKVRSCHSLRRAEGSIIVYSNTSKSPGRHPCNQRKISFASLPSWAPASTS